MSIDDAGSSATASTSSVFEENMTWSRSTIAGSATTSSSASTKEATSSRSYEQEAATSGEQEITRTTRTIVANTSGTARTIARLAELAAGWTGWNGTERLVIEESTDRGAKTNRTEESGNLDDTSEDTILNTSRVDFPSGDSRDPLGCACEKEDDSLIGRVSDRSNIEILAGGSGLGVDLLFGIASDTMEDLDVSSFNVSTVNDTFQYAWNESYYNETYIVLGDSMYPSGYTLPHIILASIVATLLMIVIVVGNMLVIIAIATEKALKNIQNWFIASLAVADFFLGLVIMPFSLANEIMGYWIFGYLWCDIYSAMDVLLCTASIMNLCLISLDRFWSITQAVDYLKNRTPARAAFMIALVWLLSALVCIPPLLGWKRPTPEEEYPKCKVSSKIRVFIKK
ncbi:hypothetical protein KPH14_007584 [Odynerus spinipes]|uniref:G-protein coupled receptors family 1 profile domain-containing protein n=1 Tax=Odynerus spinipes TaxID=1348599 RepID=A0AAD9VMI2_9HYME|nr:hypothetical protein KPH14_007584 [Odynerus spinipes]